MTEKGSDESAEMYEDVILMNLLIPHNMAIQDDHIEDVLCGLAGAITRLLMERRLPGVPMPKVIESFATMMNSLA